MGEHAAHVHDHAGRRQEVGRPRGIGDRGDENLARLDPPAAVRVSDDARFARDDARRDGNALQHLGIRVELDRGVLLRIVPTHNHRRRRLRDIPFVFGPALGDPLLDVEIGPTLYHGFDF